MKNIHDKEGNLEISKRRTNNRKNPTMINPGNRNKEITDLKTYEKNQEENLKNIQLKMT